MNISKLFLLTIVLFVSQLAVAQDADRNDSPYFQVVGDSTASFPLLSTDVDARVSGPIADVSFTQAYQNSGPLPRILKNIDGKPTYAVKAIGMTTSICFLRVGEAY